MQAHYKYLKVLFIGFKNSIEYRVDFLLGLLSCFFPILIQYFLWTSIFTNSSKTEIFGYTFDQMLMYTVLAALVAKLVSTGFEREINDDVKGGGLSRYLIQPIGYFNYRIFRFIGERLLHLIIVFALVIGFLLYMNARSGITIQITQISLFVLVIILALILKFLISYVISVIAFWIQECWGLFLAINVISMVISGGIFPIDIFGSTVVAISKMLPFYYLINFPVNILNGKLSLNYIYSGIVVQLIWIVALLISTKLLWRVGMKRYIAVGG